MVCGCVRKEEKKQKMRQRERKTGRVLFFRFQERDDRWKEGRRRDEGGVKNETKEA